MDKNRTTNEKTPGACDTEGLKNHITTLNSATVARQRKDIETQIAKLALAGHAVHKGGAGDFTVCKYGLSRYCKDFAELQAFAWQLGVH